MGQVDIGTLEKNMEDLDSINKKSPSICTQVKDKTYRCRMLYWLRIPIGFFSVGIIDAQAGATILDLQIITGTDTEISSFFFTAYNGGFFLGCLLCGFLHGNISSNLTVTFSVLLAGAVSIVTPFCDLIPSMVVVRCLAGLFLGLALCTLIADHMQMWGTEGQSLHQFNNCIYAVGGVLGPLITSAFVAEKEDEESTHPNTTLRSRFNESDTINLTAKIHSEVISYLNTTLDIPSNETGSNNSTLPRTTNVRFAFFIGGSILLFTATIFLIAFVLSRKLATLLTNTAHEETETRKIPMPLHIFLAAIIFALFLTYGCVELIFNMYLMTFVVTQYTEVTTQQGAYINTFFWASFAIARIVAVITSKYVTSVRLLYFHFTFIVGAFTGFLVSALYSRIDALTGFTCLMGVACSPMFPAMTSWTEDEIMAVTGPISSVILTGVQVGSIVLPFVLGYLMQHLSNFWFCYIIMIALGLAITCFICLLTFNRCYVDKRYGQLNKNSHKLERNCLDICLPTRRGGFSLQPQQQQQQQKIAVPGLHPGHSNLGTGAEKALG